MTGTCRSEKRLIERRSGSVRRTVLSILLILITAVGMFPNMQAAASDTPDWYMVGKTGSLDLTLTYKKSGNVTKMNGGTIAIYTVAVAADDGGNQVFDITQGKFADLTKVQQIPGMDTATLESKNASISKDIDKASESVEPDATQTISNGKVSFSNLQTGLYFIKQTKVSDDKLVMTSFLISIPDSDGNLAVSAAPKPTISKIPDGDTPPGDTPPGNTPPSTTPPSRLPQTGQLWWPVPFLAAGGILLILAGMLKKMRAANMMA